MIAADAQAWLMTTKGQTTKIHYRVFEHDDRGTVVASSSSSPGDSDKEGWLMTRLTRSGETIVQEFADTKFTYQLVSAAPVLQ